MIFLKKAINKLKVFLQNTAQKVQKGSCAYILCTVFFAFCIINILWPSGGFSQTENRMLSGFPKVSVLNITNGTFMSEFDSFCDDRLLFRNLFVSLKAHIQFISLKSENNGVYKAKDAYLISKPSYDNKTTQKNIDAIKKVSAGGGLKVSVAVVPTAYQILNDKLPLNSYDKTLANNLNSINKGFEGSNVNVIDVNSVLDNNKDKYIYYRTDHHQTAYGSFLTYKEIAKSLGFSPYEEIDFKKTDISQKFLGTNHSKFMLAFTKRDTITSYELKKNKLELSLEIPETDSEYNSLFIDENLDKKDKYTYYLDGNHAVHIIKTNAKSGRKLVIFKDSYAHSIAPFLANHYDEIHLIDLRYFNDDIFEYMYKNKLSNILVLYSSASFSGDGSLSKLKHQEKISPYGEVRYGYVEYTKAVDYDYFNDAVFVGDSLTEGMRMYSGIGGGKFYTKVGVSLYGADTLSNADGVNIFESDDLKNAGKMYIMLGINQELKPENIENYIKMYGKFIDRIREVNSDITIYVQSVMPVSQKFEQSSGILAQNILNANKALNRLAIDKCCYYIAVNEIAVGDSGYMQNGISPDGVHLSAPKCKEWVDYLKHHTVSYSFNKAKSVKADKIVFSGNSKKDTDAIAQKIMGALDFEYEMNKVSEALIYSLYGIKTEMLDSAAIYMSTGAIADEVSVIEYSYENGVDDSFIQSKISEHINERIGQMRDYNPDEVKKLERTIVLVKDGLAVIGVCNNPRTAERAIYQAIK